MLIIAQSAHCVKPASTALVDAVCGSHMKRNLQQRRCAHSPGVVFPLELEYNGGETTKMLHVRDLLRNTRSESVSAAGSGSIEMGKVGQDETELEMVGF